MDVLAPYRSRPIVLPDTLTREDVGAAAWWGMLTDGVIRPLWGDLAIAADIAETPELRALALAGLVPSRAVVGRQSAVWLHTGQFSPRRVDVMVASRVRRPDPHPLRVTTEAEWDPCDIVQVGAVRATTVQRTGLDVCRWLPLGHALRLMRPLLEAGFDVDAAFAHLDRLMGYRGILRARDVLARLDGSAPLDGTEDDDMDDDVDDDGREQDGSAGDGLSGRQARVTGPSADLAPVTR